VISSSQIPTDAESNGNVFNEAELLSNAPEFEILIIALEVSLVLCIELSVKEPSELGSVIVLLFLE
jgi:hypothetical protein